jgi:hypothetical protein
MNAMNHDMGHTLRTWAADALHFAEKELEAAQVAAAKDDSPAARDRLLRARNRAERAALAAQALLQTLLTEPVRLRDADRVSSAA